MKMRFFSPVWFLYIIIFWQGSCATNSNLSSSKKRSFAREKTGVKAFRRAVNLENKQAQNLYQKESKLKIEKIESFEIPGSLYKINRPENNFFQTLKLPKIGKYITVVVDVDRAEDEVKSQEGDDKKTDTMSGEEDFKTLLESFPNLVSKDQFNSEPIKTFKLLIIDRNKKGDFLGVYKRASKSEKVLKDIRITALIPYSKLMASPNKIRTSDLVDIRFLQRDGLKIKNRNSSGWEDEYTLLMSNFSESKSKMLEIIGRRKSDLERIRKRMIKKSVEIAKKRRSYIRERDKEKERLKKEAEKAQELNIQMDNLRKKIQEKDELISNQKETIKTQKEELDTGFQAKDQI